jgi:hypothetical protein
LAKGDYCAAVVYDWIDGTDVAELHGHWAPDQYANLLAILCLRYNNALLGVERNNHGHAVLLALQQIEHYPNLYRHNEYDQIARKVLARPPGWQTSSKSKPIMIDGLAVAIREMGGSEPARPPYRNKYFVTECRTYTVDGHTGNTGASGSMHDDRIIAYAIAEQIRKVATTSAVPFVSPGGDTKAAQFSGSDSRDEERARWDY